MRAPIARFVTLARFAASSALLFSLFLLTFAHLPAQAQTRPRPPNLQPVPEPPPPPKGYELDSALEPQITTVKRGTETVEEYRMGGKLYMMKVTPNVGAPYFLVDHHGDGTFTRQNAHDTGLRPPMWVIYSF